MNNKVIVLSITAALLSSCATVGSSKNNLSQQQSVIVKPQPHVVRTPTARECQKKYKVLVTDTPVEDMSGYLSCMDLAEQKYGVKTPRFEPIEPSSDILVDVHHSWHPGEMKLRNGHILRGSQLRILKSIMPDAQVARDNIIDAFSRYWFEYDKFDNTIKIEPLRYLAGQYSRSSYVSLRGEISNKKAKNFRLVFKYYGSQWLFAKDLQVNVDGKNYNLNGLSFSRDHTDKVWEVASIPLKGKGGGKSPKLYRKVKM
ncbi:hypothetical protein ACU8V3_19235 [Cobetia marina]